MILEPTDEMLETFIKHFPAFPNAFLIGGPADVFVIEVTDQVSFLPQYHLFALINIVNCCIINALALFQLQKLKVEPVVLHYISRMSTLQG